MKLLTIVLLLGTLLCSLCGAGYCAGNLNPVVCNGDFEANSLIWSWSAMGGVRASYKLSTDSPHSGKQCLALTNESGVGPNVYVRALANVEVRPDTEYELSCWAKGTEVANGAGSSHFTDWAAYSLPLPTGTYGWTRVSTKLKTKPNQYVLAVGLNLSNVCKLLAIDDVALKPVGVVFEGSSIEASILAPSRVIGDDCAGYLGVRVNSLKHNVATVDASIGSAGAKLFHKVAKLRAGESEVEWEWTSGKVPFGDYECRVKLLDARGNVLAEGKQTISKISSPLSKGIDDVVARLPEFDRLYKQCKAKKIPLDYVDVTKTMLNQMIPLARKDVQMGHDWRAEYSVKDFNRFLDEAMVAMRAYLADPSLAPNAVRYQTGKVKIDGLSMVGSRKDSNGAKSQGPLFFNGYGHFGQIRRDMPRWPGYAVNLLQCGEIGPSHVLVGEDKVDLSMIKMLQGMLDDAAKRNVRVDFLLSPHYFPQWALDKWPYLTSGGGHFFGFCVDLPEAKQVIEKFLRLVIPMVKDKPALNSFCLSNEPVLNNTANSPNTKPMWGAYLAKIHGDLKTMNERYGSSYAKFEDVPVPGNESYDEPQFYDWCVFNQERFAAWHKWMADICHELAPEVPVHSKVMSMAIPHRFTISWGCDPELFGELSDMNGNDCLIRGAPSGGYAIPFHLQNMTYDLQRSLALKPIFNSENHPTDDRSTYYVPPEHFTTMLWQGALHGQAATTIWAWERCYMPDNDLYGNVMDRPGCAQAVGTTTLNLNRFAKEMTALQTAKAPVAIVFSIASITRSAKYQEVLYHAYNGLNYSGVKIDFISEKQLAKGDWSKYKMIIVPQASHVLPSTFSVFREMPKSTRIVMVGDGLVKDPYGKDYPAEDLKAIREKSLCLADADPEKVLWPALRNELGKVGGLSEYSVVDASTGEPVWGVEWLPAKVGGRTIINIVDVLVKPAKVKIMRAGREVLANDLLSLGGREPVGDLKPITPVLAELK